MAPRNDPSTTSFVAAIDAGGTKTVAVIADLEGRELARGSAGPGNPAVAGPEASRQALSTALRKATEKARELEANLDEAAALLRIGIAGVELPDHARPFAAWAKEAGLCREAFASNDAHLVFDLQAEDIELALIAGTGSTCWGRDPAGHTRRVGGWGYLADDRGSGFALGSAALHLAVCSLDGRAQEPEFERIVFEHWQANGEAELLERLHQGSYAEARSLIAALSVRVFELADAGLPSAGKLVDDQVSQLVDLVRCTRRKLLDPPSADTPAALIFAGSMVAKRKKLRQAVIDGLDFQPTRVRIADDPVSDGIAQARSLLLGQAHMG